MIHNKFERDANLADDFTKLKNVVIDMAKAVDKLVEGIYGEKREY